MSYDETHETATFTFEKQLPVGEGVLSMSFKFSLLLPSQLTPYHDIVRFNKQIEEN